MNVCLYVGLRILEQDFWNDCKLGWYCFFFVFLLFFNNVACEHCNITTCLLPFWHLIEICYRRVFINDTCIKARLLLYVWTRCLTYWMCSRQKTFRHTYKPTFIYWPKNNAHTLCLLWKNRIVVLVEWCSPAYCTCFQYFSEYIFFSNFMFPGSKPAYTFFSHF